MANFQTFITLIIQHSFFAQGLCRGLSFVPTPTTKKLLAQHQLMIRTSDHDLVLVGDIDANITRNEELDLRFSVFAKDPHFASYTREMINKDTPLFYTTRTAKENVLQATTFYTPESLNDDPVNTRQVIQPIFIVDLYLQPNVTQHNEKYAIQLNARDIYWKYYFFGELANLDLEIHDLNSQSPMGFTFCNEPIAKNGKAFISQTPITLNEAPKEKFQLKDKNNSGKVLIKRLPNAGTHLIGKERDSNGQPILVAEIYINQ